jgi:hypothetical protein
MSVQQLFYRSVVPVNPTRHRDISVKTGESHSFASEANSVPVTAVEFGQAAAELPVVFAGNETSVFPAVILGSRANENLLLDAAGRWRGRYVPAFIRRYPFVFSQDTEGTTFTLNIDETFEGCNTAGRGERLFDADGNRTQYLQTVLGFLQDYQARFQRTRTYCDRLLELKLLVPMQAQFAPGGDRRVLSGFMAVDRERLKALPPETLAQMMSTDELECTFLHLASLRHFQDLLDRFPPVERPAAGEPAPAEPAAESAAQEVVH